MRVYKENHPALRDLLRAALFPGTFPGSKNPFYYYYEAYPARNNWWQRWDILCKSAKIFSAYLLN